MTNTRIVEFSTSCRIEVNHWDSMPPDASIIYTEHGDAWHGSRETDCPITLGEAQEAIEVLQEYVNALLESLKKPQA